jgi:hypothetical protein
MIRIGRHHGSNSLVASAHSGHNLISIFGEGHEVRVPQATSLRIETPRV